MALLSNTGTLIFISAVAAKFIGQMQGKHTVFLSFNFQFLNYAVSPDGCTIATILGSTKYIACLLALDPILGIPVYFPLN